MGVAEPGRMTDPSTSLAAGAPRGAPSRRGPRGLPLLGVALELRRDPLQYFVDLMLRYGDVVRFAIGTAPVVMINHPAAVKHVLQDNHRNYRKSRFYRAFRPLLGGGIFLSEGNTWLAQRRTANPFFGGLRFEAMARDIAGAASDMLDRWQGSGKATDGTIVLMPEMMRLTLDALTRALFRVRLSGEYDALHSALTEILRRIERQVWSFMPVPDPLLRRLDPSYRQALATVDTIVERLIRDRRAEARPPEDLLSALIAAADREGPRAQAVLRDQVVSMIAAGHESTACALAWTFCLLARNPEVEARLHREVDKVLGGRTPNFADLGRLPYTRMVFEEAMRIYPPVWTISRAAVAEDTIAGTRIPRGTTVMLCPYAVHRHPRFWHEPDRFDPDRFRPEMQAERPRYAYFPFGGGPRICLGNRFALMEAQIMLAMVAQRWRLTLPDGIEPKPEPMITLRPQEGTRMRLIPRATAPQSAG